jgi:hypothetical protein
MSLPKTQQSSLRSSLALLLPEMLETLKQEQIYHSLHLLPGFKVHRKHNETTLGALLNR